MVILGSISLSPGHCSLACNSLLSLLSERHNSEHKKDCKSDELVSSFATLSAGRLREKKKDRCFIMTAPSSPLQRCRNGPLAARSQPARTVSRAQRSKIISRLTFFLPLVQPELLRSDRVVSCPHPEMFFYFIKNQIFELTHMFTLYSNAFEQRTTPETETLTVTCK